ncbi:glycosyltransferase family 39 protein [Candidatus Daviesbacteria bacterium]|nr:glycosyltransferase family 39 protein [Candidatus Daviesbacteria bacterium]
MKFKLSFIFIFFLALVLRLINISPFKFYPDAYQNLIVAQNILNYHSVLGFLGKEGTLYPDFFMWTRPIYPLLIVMFNFLIKNESLAAQIVATLTSILSIPVAYLFIFKIFNSKLTAILGAILLTISFNHTVWSGFIYTESTGIFILFIFLWLLISNLKKASVVLDLKDLLKGVIFSLAVFTRYEYIILFLPTFFIIFKESQKPQVKIVNILIGFLIGGSIIFSLLFPIKETLFIIYQQMQSLIQIGAIFLAVFFFLVILLKFIPGKFKNEVVNLLTIFLSLLVLLFVSLTDPTAFVKFFSTDFFLGILTILGIIFLLFDKKYQNLNLFSVLGVSLLIPIYYKINPQMQRYLTHLIPFLLIPASYGFFKILNLLNSQKLYKYPLAFLVISLAVLQIAITAIGIRFWNQGVWFRQSYEEKSANILKTKIESSNRLLLASFPESYYFFTNISTHSLTNEYPFIYIDDSLNSKPIYIIEDMGMHDLFPNFSNFLDKNMSNFIKEKYWVREIYHYSIRSKVEDKPVIIYEVSVNQLKGILKNSTAL